MNMKALCAVVLPGLVLATKLFAGETITVRADAWPPYNGDPAAELPGYSIEIMKAVFEKQGYTIDYQNMPWTRVLAECQKGTIDAAVDANAEEAKELVLPKEPIATSENAFFVKKGSAWTYKGVESLKSMRLGTISGYVYSDELTAHAEANKDSGMIEAMTGDDALEKNIGKLLIGRIDVLIENPQVVAWTARSMKIEDGMLVKAGVASQPEPLYVAFAKGERGEKLAKLFDEGMAALRASGELSKILAKYGVTDGK